MKALTHENGFAVLAIAVFAALVIGLALVGHGTCW